MKDKNIIKEAIADLKKVREEAMESAKKSLAESMPDEFEKIVKETLEKKMYGKDTDENSEVEKEEPKEVTTEEIETPSSNDNEKSLDLMTTNEDENMDDILDLTNSSDDEVETNFDNLDDNSNVEITKDEAPNGEDDVQIDMHEIEEALMKLEAEESNDENGHEDEKIEIITDEKPIEDSEEGSTEGSEEENVEENQSRTYSNGRNQTLKPESFKDYAGDRMRDAVKNENVTKKVTSLKESNTKLNKKLNGLLSEKEELVSINKELHEVLKKYKDQLYEMSVFNTNLAHVNNLFVEHSTTSDEKKNIIKKFKSINTIEESKQAYKQTLTELTSKAPIKEQVEKKITTTINTSASKLTESTAYESEGLKKMKGLMEKIERREK